MEQHVKEFNLDGFKVVIDYDEFSESPREWSEAKWYGVDGNSPKELIIDENNRFNPSCDELKDKYWFRVYKYEHSKECFRLYPIDKWDTSFYGIIAVSKSMFDTKEKAQSYIEGELELYTNWRNGEIYGYQIFDENNLENEVDSCWSFFDIDECEREAREVIASIVKAKEHKSVQFWANNSD